MHEAQLIGPAGAAVFALALMVGLWFGLRLGRRGCSSSPYHAAVEQWPEGVVIADARTGRVLLANRAFLQSCGHTLRELKQFRLGELFYEPGNRFSGCASQEISRSRPAHVHAGEAAMAQAAPPWMRK